MTKIICDICGNEVIMTKGFSTFNYIQFLSIQQNTAPVKHMHDYCVHCTTAIVSEVNKLKLAANKKKNATT